MCDLSGRTTVGVGASRGLGPRIPHAFTGADAGREPPAREHTLMNVAGTMALGVVEVLPDDPTQRRFPMNHVRSSTRTRRGRTRAAAAQRVIGRVGGGKYCPFVPPPRTPVTTDAAVGGPPYGRSS
jgi:hypothetical protein